MFAEIIVFVGLCCSFQLIGSRAAALPSALQLGGAVVAAVEEDAAGAPLSKGPSVSAFALVDADANTVARQLLTALTSDGDLMEAERLLKDVDEGRGRFRKRRKMLKYLYPLLVGVLIAKSVVLPLVLKILTALSTTSFVISKIALATSGLLALKWIFSGSNADEPAKQRPKLEIYHLPPGKAYGHHRGAGGNPGNWAYDMAWSDSNVVGHLDRYPHKYIPLGGSADSDAGSYSDSGAVRHPHHHIAYDDVIDGRPFL